MAKTMAARTVAGFSQALGSSAPTPGGGGASAVVAGIGVALGQMVASLTQGKERYVDVQGRIEEISPRLEELRRELLSLADADAEAFEPLARAYRLPRGTEEERRHKADEMEVALAGACVPPIRIMERTCEAIALVDEVSRIGSTLALSDAGAGAAVLSAALRAASLNVFVNAGTMRDRDRAEELTSRAQSLLDDGCARADEVFRRVEEMVR
jgi:formiminotetrahydrofolate cyclodeaminase